MYQSLKYLSLIALATLPVFSQCRKSDPYVAPVNSNYSDTTFPDTDLTNHFNFKPGTYWIYRDSLSGRIDSFYVSSNVTQAWQSLVHTGPGNAHFEYLGFYVIGIGAQNIDNIHINDSFSLSLTLIMNYSHLVYLAGRQTTHYLPLFLYPVDSPFTSFDTSNTASLVGTYSAFELNSITYADVSEISQTNSTINDRFFICNDHGIIKMVIDHPTQSTHHVWELQRWHIVL